MKPYKRHAFNYQLITNGIIHLVVIEVLNTCPIVSAYILAYFIHFLLKRLLYNKVINSCLFC